MKACGNNDMKLLSLQPEWAIIRDVWTVEGLNMGQMSNPSLEMDVFKINGDDDEDTVNS